MNIYTLATLFAGIMIGRKTEDKKKEVGSAESENNTPEDAADQDDPDDPKEKPIE